MRHFMGFLEVYKNQSQNARLHKIVIPNARPIAGDLETRFGGNKPNWLKQSGVPARAPQGLRLAGMTVFGVLCQLINFPWTLVPVRGNDDFVENIDQIPGFGSKPKGCVHLMAAKAGIVEQGLVMHLTSFDKFNSSLD